MTPSRPTPSAASQQRVSSEPGADPHRIRSAVDHSPVHRDQGGEQMATVAFDRESARSASLHAQALTVLAAVRTHAAAIPARAALVGELGVVGYGELWDRVQEHAAGLVARSGPQPGPVAVPAVHDPATVVALL